MKRKEISRLMGFDIRRHTRPYMALRWGLAQREEYLLRPEVAWPLSVDRQAWPSRFYLEAEEQPLGAPGDIALAFTARTQHYQLFWVWDDMAEMLSEYRPPLGGDCGVAVGLLLPELYPPDSEIFEDAWWNAVFDSPTQPARADPKWERIGYDVANSGLCSALCSFSLPAQERTAAREAWGGQLNEHGLFSKPERAVRFCLEANVHMKSDGPFYVFELLLMWGNPALG